MNKGNTAAKVSSNTGEQYMPTHIASFLHWFLVMSRSDEHSLSHQDDAPQPLFKHGIDLDTPINRQNVLLRNNCLMSKEIHSWENGSYRSVKRGGLFLFCSLLRDLKWNLKLNKSMASKIICTGFATPSLTIYNVKSLQTWPFFEEYNINPKCKQEY